MERKKREIGVPASNPTAKELGLAEAHEGVKRVRTVEF